MKRKYLFLFMSVGFVALKLNAQTASASAWSLNPFSKASALPYQAPYFDKIKDEHYKPALEEGIRQQLDETKKIAENPAKPTFENTIVAMEKSGQLLNRVTAAFSAVTGAN